MRKSLYIIVFGLLGLVGFSRADVNSLNVTPVTQSAISGSLVAFTVTGNNTTGDAYLKYVLPNTANHSIAFQNATLTPLNNALLSLGIEHDPVFYIPANSSFSVTITAKVITNVRTFPTLSTDAIFASDMQINTLLTSAVAQITPIADLLVTNILTGTNPSFSGDNVSYFVTLQNIGSSSATGISFLSTFPIPTLFTPTANFNGITHTYDHINYPQDFVWTGSYLNNLNPGQSITILLNASMTQAFAVGTSFNQIAKATTLSNEYTTGNNVATASAIVQAPANVRITKTLLPFTGFNAGDQVHYVLTYGNNGGKIANNVVVTDTAPAGIGIPVATFTLGSLPAGSGGTLYITGTLSNFFAAGHVFVNIANISTTSIESLTGDNIAFATGTIVSIANINVNIIANNLTRPQLDNAPYGSGPSIFIQAVSGDLIQLTLTYANFGNTSGTNATIGISGTQGILNLGSYNSNIGTLPLNTTGTLIVTGIVGPKNYISLTPTARLSYNSGQLITDTVMIQEPLVCGDGLVTRNEPCDTQGNIGVLYSGQVCQNQQGSCMLVTQSIVNNACINYQYNNPLGGVTTGQTCSSVTAPLVNTNCNSMTGSAPVSSGTGYNVNLTCRGNNTTSTTPISIYCGNGTILSGLGSSFNGTCNYTSSFVGNAQCKVANDASNTACRLPIASNAGQCSALTPLDGSIALVNSSNDADSTFRCETTNGVTAQSIVIDCGNGTQHTANNTSVLEAGCSYVNVNTPQTYNVRCLVDGISAPACQQNLIVDEGTFGRCGDGVRQGYEKCDDGGLNGTSNSTCTLGCDIKNSLPVGCFNLGNNNISVQENELLPFWRNVDGDKNTVTSCDSNKVNKIQANSLQCTFKIYNSNGLVDTFEAPCKNSNNSPIFNHFNSIGASSFTNAYGKYSTLIDSNITNGTFGEYKISLENVTYNYCNGTNFVSGSPLQRVCEANFTVTKPYLAQKSSFGTTPRATNIKLDGYTNLDGTDLINGTDLAEIMVLDGSVYNGGNKIQTMINTFITKYEKLAITLPQSSLQGTAFEGLDITVKVVPKQKIYILQSATRRTITMKNIKSFTTPFTIVTKNIDLVIKGNVDYNGMFLVKGGTITFEKSDEVIGGDRCPTTQVVKGIFITDVGFLGGNPLSNQTNTKERCSYGGLDVKGILIGDNIENIVEARRSQLNHWFKVGGTSATAIKAERRNEIFNGAALLIEYSPSLWNTLPPGASEFTKVLDIYKQ
ncbi:MAG: hypothetical protein NTY80_02755 [candidate division SR1 bacterium]|nr:hypothetical protein [candidate division SR1 bacterium]